MKAWRPKHMTSLTFVTRKMDLGRRKKRLIPDHIYLLLLKLQAGLFWFYCTHSASAGIAGVDLVWLLKSNRRHIATPFVVTFGNSLKSYDKPIQ